MAGVSCSAHRLRQGDGTQGGQRGPEMQDTNGLRIGDAVLLVVPDNPRLHGAEAEVAMLAAWGAHVLTDAAASGRYRAAWEEMRRMQGSVCQDVRGVATVGAPREVATRTVPQGRDAGYTGNVCDRCGSARMRRSGSCETCEDCGNAGGCG